MDRYRIEQELGSGTYGVVWKATVRETGQVVAIKKFKESDEDEATKKTSLREVRLLKQLRHDNIISLLEVFRRKGKLYLVFDYMDKTILEVIEKEYPNGLPEQEVKKYMYQLLRGLDFCHTHNVIHRDVKPENILVSNTGSLKICDFGFARVAQPGGKFTDYVATRWYRSPELLVGDVVYTKAVDLWACGCILAEITTGMPLFPGESDLDQISHITRCFGRLVPRHVQVFRRNDLFRGVAMPEPRDNAQLETLERRFPRADASWMQFLKACLRLDPEQRVSATSLLDLPYFTDNNWRQRYEQHLSQVFEQEHRRLSQFQRVSDKNTPPPTGGSTGSRGSRSNRTPSPATVTNSTTATGGQKHSSSSSSSSKHHHSDSGSGSNYSSKATAAAAATTKHDNYSSGSQNENVQRSNSRNDHYSNSVTMQQQQTTSSKSSTGGGSGTHSPSSLLPVGSGITNQHSSSSSGGGSSGIIGGGSSTQQYPSSSTTTAAMMSGSNSMLPDIRGAMPASRGSETGSSNSFLPSINTRNSPTPTSFTTNPYISSSSGSGSGAQQQQQQQGSGGLILSTSSTTTTTASNNPASHHFHTSTLHNQPSGNTGGGGAYGGVGGGYTFTTTKNKTPTNTSTTVAGLGIGGGGGQGSSSSGANVYGSSGSHNTSSNFGLYGSSMSSSKNTSSSSHPSHAHPSHQLPSLQAGGSSSSATSIFANSPLYVSGHGSGSGSGSGGGSNTSQHQHQQHQHQQGGSGSGGHHHHGPGGGSSSSHSISPYALPGGGLNLVGTSSSSSTHHHHQTNASSSHQQHQQHHHGGLGLSYKKKNPSKKVSSVNSMGLPSYLPSSNTTTGSSSQQHGNANISNTENIHPNVGSSSSHHHGGGGYSSSSGSGSGGGGSSNTGGGPNTLYAAPNFGITGVAAGRSSSHFGMSGSNVPPLHSSSTSSMPTSSDGDKKKRH